MDFSLNDFAADTSYSLLHRRYDSNILLGHAEVKFEGYKPIAWTAEVHFSVEHDPDRAEISQGRRTSGAHLEANGQLQNFLQPQVDVRITRLISTLRGLRALPVEPICAAGCYR